MGEGRLADSENAALKGGKAAMSKMEGKIRELEAELAATQSRSGEAMKAFQRAERKAKELNFAQTEDKKNQDRMSAGQQAPDEAEDLQAADRGGRGDRRPQPGQVPQGPTGAGGDRGESQARHGPLNLMFILNLSSFLINPPKMFPSFPPTLKLK